MDWIKVNPDTMPPVGTRVILSTKNPDGSKTTDVATYGGEKFGWLVLLPGFHSTTLEEEIEKFEITHWMPMPEPQED